MEQKKFDMAKRPQKQKAYLKPLTWILSIGDTRKHHLKITKKSMKGLKPPYILLCTHMAFLDFKVATMAVFPHRANYIVAIDGFIGREKLLRNAGCICKRKFTNDTQLVKNIKYALEKHKKIVSIYPEARYSIAGTTAILPDSLGKLVKMMRVPVVVLNIHGNYLTTPVWNLEDRLSPISADMSQIINQDEINTLDEKEINQRIRKSFIYDEYKWQKDNNIIIDFKNRAKGLHKVLYLCPNCHQESKMDSNLDELWCNSCKKRWKMTTLGEMEAIEGKTEFSHIPSWYEYEREMVKKEILSNKYHFEDEVRIDSLPNALNFVSLGKGHLTHNDKGFFLQGEGFSVKKEPLSMYSCHIEYDYLGKGEDCISFSTLEDTYYIYPLNKLNIVTKIHFATEELYKLQKENM